jgi:5-(carboxyamino)imidazole ribonucleotide mutase
MGAEASVLIIMGSKSDYPVAVKAIDILEELEIPHYVEVCSAHRAPERLVEIVEGFKGDVIIAIAGLSAALPGTVAAHTLKPVIGVPVSGMINLDSILSVVQMPPGIPVGAVGLDRGENAALLAAEIIAVTWPELLERLHSHRERMKAKVLKDSLDLKG